MSSVRRNYGIPIGERGPASRRDRREKYIDRFYLAVFSVLLGFAALGWLGFASFLIWYFFFS